jgi:hypothetical protein
MSSNYFVAKRIIFVVVFFGCFINGFAIPPGPFPDAVFDRNIKTVQLYKEGWEFSYPILELNDTKTLLLSFDDLDAKYKNYNYLVVHCNADWMPSRISYSDYMDGFYQNPLTQYEMSVSTHIPYCHYTIRIPNENLRLKLSGNYILLVYEENDDKPVIMKRFVVVDNRVRIIPEVSRPVLPVYQNNYQEIDFNILYPDFPIDNPYQTLKIIVVKNNQWKFSITDLKPLFIRSSELVYSNQDKDIVPGGNEFRSFDIKNLKYQSANILSINYKIDSWQVELKPDKPRNNISYFYDQDLNGKYLVQNQQGTNADIDAEYVHVLFNFPMAEPLTDGDMYVFGGFSDFNCYEDYRMVYNTERKAYELDMLAKQGYYNYEYVFVPKKDSDAVDESYFEGSFYETENDYVIYVYYQPFGSRYDRLIGATVVNSLKRNLKIP